MRLQLATVRITCFNWLNADDRMSIQRSKMCDLRCYAAKFATITLRAARRFVQRAGQPSVTMRPNRRIELCFECSAWSLLSERHQRIDSRCAPGGKNAAGGADRCQHNRGAEERGPILWPYAKEERGDETTPQHHERSAQ